LVNTERRVEIDLLPVNRSTPHALSRRCRTGLSHHHQICGDGPRASSHLG
jgi:hypothetical protein